MRPGGWSSWSSVFVTLTCVRRRQRQRQRQRQKCLQDAAARLKDSQKAFSFPSLKVCLLLHRPASASSPLVLLHLKRFGARLSRIIKKIILLKCRLHLHQTCFSCGGGGEKKGKKKTKTKKSFRPSDFRLQRPSKRLTLCLFLSAQRDKFRVRTKPMPPARKTFASYVTILLPLRRNHHCLTAVELQVIAYPSMAMHYRLRSPKRNRGQCMSSAGECDASALIAATCKCSCTTYSNQKPLPTPLVP